MLPRSKVSVLHLIRYAAALELRIAHIAVWSVEVDCTVACCGSGVNIGLRATSLRAPAIAESRVKSRWAAVVPLLMMLMTLEPSTLRNAVIFRLEPVSAACTRNAPGRT